MRFSYFNVGLLWPIYSELKGPLCITILPLLINKYVNETFNNIQLHNYSIVYITYVIKYRLIAIIVK